MPLIDGPIISPSDLNSAQSDHVNINGPALIRIPEWVENPLGRYYLYFADHKGDRIQLAVADTLAGPWRIHEGGGNAQTPRHPFLQAPPAIPAQIDRAALAQPRAESVPSVLDDCVVPTSHRRMSSWMNLLARSDSTTTGSTPSRHQVSRVATSRNGVDFESRSEILAPPDLRMFFYRENGYGLAMPGGLFKSRSGLAGFEAGPVLFEPNMRHAGLWLRGEELWVFWTRVGDAPERILLSLIDLRGDWTKWREFRALEVHRATEHWEGSQQPIAPSVRSAINRPVNQLRDPFLFEEGGEPYLVYAVAGEAGLAIARLEFL